MDVIINNPPAAVQTAPLQGYGVQGYGAPAYGYAPQYGEHHGGGFGFVLLALLGVFLFLRWNRFGGRRRRWAMMDGRGGQPGGPQATSQEGQGWKSPRMPWMRDSAAEIARERFARGEINADELGAILKGLEAE
ncbi:hypothetical protein [Deinococcus sp.]|uniref:hypothetical protein n=1 Tax=Deinococcus sp. TaxID=47478 RepID=UPI003C7A58D8